MKESDGFEILPKHNHEVGLFCDDDDDDDMASRYLLAGWLALVCPHLVLPFQFVFIQLKVIIWGSYLFACVMCQVSHNEQEYSSNNNVPFINV